MKSRPALLIFTLLLAACSGATPGMVERAPPGPQASAPARPAVQQRPRASQRTVNLAALPSYRHAPAQTLLRETTRELLAAAGQPDLLSNVSILDSGGYNAILQGDRLYVTRGLLALMNDRGELAAILAHEIGHAIARHARSRVLARRAAIASTIDVARTFRDPELTRAALAANQRSLAVFSRVQEHEADRIGIALMAKAGYDPQSAVSSLRAYARMQSLFRNLARINASRRASPLATHPPTPERIALASRQVAAMGAIGGRRDRARYLAAISGVRFGSDGRNGFLRGRNFFHHGRNLAMTMPRGFVPASTRAGIGGLRKGGSAFLVFAPLQQTFAEDPQGALRNWLDGIDGRVEFASLPGGRGAMARADAPGEKRRVAIVVSDGRPYTVVMFAKQTYPGFEADFRATVRSVRTLSQGDLALARPRKLLVVRAQGPQTIRRYARLNGDPEYGPQLLLALNNLPSAAAIRPGMQLKVLAPDAGSYAAGDLRAFGERSRRASSR